MLMLHFRRKLEKVQPEWYYEMIGDVLGHTLLHILIAWMLYQWKRLRAEMV
jgi:hypothetical protein